MILTEFKRVGHDLCNRGLVSYAGNLSIRLGDRLVITRRGCSLGNLEENDLIETGIENNGIRGQFWDFPLRALVGVPHRPQDNTGIEDLVAVISQFRAHKGLQSIGPAFGGIDIVRKSGRSAVGQHPQSIGRLGVANVFEVAKSPVVQRGQMVVTVRRRYVAQHGVGTVQAV